MFLQYYYIVLGTKTFKKCNLFFSASGSIFLPEELLRTDVHLQAHEEKPVAQAKKRRLRQQKGENSALGTEIEHIQTHLILTLILILDFTCNIAHIHLDVFPLEDF